ncbi:hypothetical protein NDU88_003343, partial [Pleurodeles waltl]
AVFWRCPPPAGGGMTPLVFSFVPIIRYLSKVAKEHDIVFFEPTLTFGTAYAHHNNLT